MNRTRFAAENKSPRTIQNYGEAVDVLNAFLTRKGMHTDPAAITREHPAEWVHDIQWFKVVMVVTVFA